MTAPILLSPWPLCAMKQAWKLTRLSSTQRAESTRDQVLLQLSYLILSSWLCALFTQICTRKIHSAGCTQTSLEATLPVLHLQPIRMHQFLWCGDISVQQSRGCWFLCKTPLTLKWMLTGLHSLSGHFSYSNERWYRCVSWGIKITTSTDATTF